MEAVWNTNALLVYGTNYPTGSAYLFTDISLDAGVNWDYLLMPQFQDYSAFNSKIVDESRWYLTGTQFLSDGFVLFTDNAGGVPVELVSFSAEAFSSQVNLIWSTATELNNLGFEVERSTAEEWSTIGFVRGKGTTTEIQNYSFIDDLFGLSALKILYRLKQIDFNGTYSYSDEIEVNLNPLSFSLEQNWPNPFNNSCVIRYSIPKSSQVTLKIFNTLGEEIATLVNEEKPVGTYKVNWNAANLPSGVYFYRIQSVPSSSSGQAFIDTKKMILLKSRRNIMRIAANLFLLLSFLLAQSIRLKAQLIE